MKTIGWNTLYVAATLSLGSACVTSGETERNLGFVVEDGSGKVHEGKATAPQSLDGRTHRFGVTFKLPNDVPIRRLPDSDRQFPDSDPTTWCATLLPSTSGRFAHAR